MNTFIVALWFLWCGSIAVQTEPDRVAADLTRKLRADVPSYSLSAPSFAGALAKVSAQFEIPMGIEWVEAPDLMTEVKFSASRSTPQEIIEALLKSHAGYEMGIENGVVHVFPAGWRTDRRNFLNLPVDRFDLKDQTVAFGRFKLRKQVAQMMRPPSPLHSGSGEAASIASGQGDRPVTLTIEATNVRQILDQLALAADFKIWVVTYPQNERLSSTGFRSSVSLYRSIAKVGDDQPVWDFFRWGQELPKPYGTSPF
jgi:hypothetical protein